MKKEYATLLLSVVTFENLDVITASNGFKEQGYDFGDYFSGNEMNGGMEE